MHGCSSFLRILIIGAPEMDFRPSRIDNHIIKSEAMENRNLF